MSSGGRWLEFELNYLFGLNLKKCAECMVCYRAVSHIKKYNIERHYITRHKQEYAKYENEERERLVLKLKEAFAKKLEKGLQGKRFLRPGAVPCRNKNASPIARKLKKKSLQQKKQQYQDLPKELEPIPRTIQITENPIQTVMCETSAFEIKSESPIDIKLEPDSIFNSPNEATEEVELYITQSSTLSNELEPVPRLIQITENPIQMSKDVKLDPDAILSVPPSHNGATYAQHEVVNSFVIYELESAAEAATNTTTTKPILSANLHRAPTKPPPTLLNSKFRKRPRGEVDAAAAPVVKHKHVAMPTTTTSAHSLSALPEDDSATAAAPTKTVAELKVKCFCRLSNPAYNAPPSNGKELRDFYARMFTETRKLTQEQQRAVKMELLSAVCQAEADVEAGKFCEKCCS